jgi:hypothetical protein
VRCLERRDFDNFGLPISINAAVPKVGDSIINISQAVAEDGLRLRGTK